MKFPNMFSPVQIGTVTVPNRFVVPPMGNDLANTDGSLSERSLSYYQARAKGGFGLITIESTVEKDSELGGNFRIASYPTGKGQISEAIRSMIVRAKQAGVNIRLNTEATEEPLRALAPNAVILATGSVPLVLPIPGLADCGYVTAQDLLLGKTAAGRRALVVGGGMVGCEAAEYLAERGHQVAIVEMKDVIAADVTPENRRYMFRNFEEDHVLLQPGAKAPGNAVLATAAAKEAGVAYVLMGHGTAHVAKVTYSQMATQMDKLGYENVFIGTVEGEPEDTSCEAVIAAVKEAGYTTVVLRPLMVVAGDHANNDMAGADEDSWKTMFEAAGLTVNCQISGLGRIDAIHALYVAHTKAAIDAIA